MDDAATEGQEHGQGVMLEQIQEVADEGAAGGVGKGLEVAADGSGRFGGAPVEGTVGDGMIEIAQGFIHLGQVTAEIFK